MIFLSVSKIRLKLLWSSLSLFFIKLLRKVNVDQTIFFVLLAKLWNVLSAPVTILLIISKFSPELQGYYYTFASLLFLQVFMELGLGTVIVQFASHEWSKLSLDAQGYIVGEKRALSRLISLAHLSFRWYVTIAVIVVSGLIVGGYFFFVQGQIFGVSWKMPWFFLCLLTGVSISLVPIWSLLEGCNQVVSLYTYRFFQSLFSCLFLWIAIFCGAKLWAASAPVVASLLCAGWFLTKKYKNFLKTLSSDLVSDQRIGWRKEILPMQWRIAVSWISGYFIFFLFTPVLFKFHGPVIAGQFGMTWSIIGIIGGVAWAWFIPKIPQFGMLIARKDYRKLDDLFWQTTKIALAVAISVAVIIGLMFSVLIIIKHPVAERFLPLLPTGIFLLAQVVWFITMPLGAYLRAHKKEPLMFVSLAAGIFMGLSTLFLGKYYSATGMAIGYLSIGSILVVIVVIIWYRCRIEWHKS
jgi:O-antigen/teichoic acid export membrane protein